MFKNKMLAQYQVSLATARKLKKGMTLNHVMEDASVRHFTVISVGIEGRTLLLKSNIGNAIVEYSYRASCAGFIPSQEHLIKNILNDVKSKIDYAGGTEETLAELGSDDAPTFTIKQ